jgi:hypothetical protein
MFSVGLNPSPTVTFTAPDDLCIDAGAQNWPWWRTSASWKLDGVNFDDGGVATGTLDYDELNNRNFIDWSISVSGGSLNVSSLNYLFS